jgi:hypothetical protein
MKRLEGAWTFKVALIGIRERIELREKGDCTGGCELQQMVPMIRAQNFSLSDWLWVISPHSGELLLAVW